MNSIGRSATGARGGSCASSGAASALDTLEREFQAFVLEGVPGIERRVVGTSRAAQSIRLAIYSDAYRARLAEALEHNFPLLAKLLGDGQFRELANRYALAHRSSNFSIRWYGDRLADFILRERPYRSQPLVAELAHWEWNMTLAFDAADAAVLRAGTLEAMGPEQWPGLRLSLHPSVRLLSLRTNAPAVWRALDRDEAPPAFEAGEPQAWVIWRKELDIFFKSVDPAEAGALAAIRRGETFASLCEVLSGLTGEERAAGTAAHLLRQWLTDELLAAG